MSSVAISGNASGAGTLTIAAPNTASNYTLTLPTATTTLVGTDATQTLTNKTLTSPTIDGTPVMGASVITRGTAVASTSGTSIDFTSIPAWVKRITVMLYDVSTSGSSQPQIQIGSGSVTSTGYTSIGQNGITIASSTTGFITTGSWAASSIKSGAIVLTAISSTVWVASGVSVDIPGSNASYNAGRVTIGGTLDRVRITTVNGTDTFDAGSINILYE